MKISKGTIATLIIITIAGMAFAAGFLQEGVLSDVEEASVKVSEKEFVLARMDSGIREIIEDDRARIRSGFDEVRRAQEIALELEITNDTLSDIERDLLINKISNALYNYISFAYFTDVVTMYNHWYVDGNISDYYFATEQREGFDLFYSKEEFETFNTSKRIIRIQTDVQFFGYFPFAEYIMSFGITPTEFLRPNVHENYVEFLKQPLFALQQEITDTKIMISELENNAGLHGYGVSLITISTILAAAMATQLNDRDREREFSQVKAKLFDDKLMIVTKQNKIALPFLFVALILSALGLLLPILFRLIF